MFTFRRFALGLVLVERTARLLPEYLHHTSLRMKYTFSTRGPKQRQSKHFAPLNQSLRRCYQHSGPSISYIHNGRTNKGTSRTPKALQISPSAKICQNSLKLKLRSNDRTLHYDCLKTVLFIMTNSTPSLAIFMP